MYSCLFFSGDETFQRGTNNKKDRRETMRKQKMLKKAMVLLCTTAMVVTGIPVTGNVTQAATVDFYSEERIHCRRQ